MNSKISFAKDKKYKRKILRRLFLTNFILVVMIVFAGCRAGSVTKAVISSNKTDLQEGLEKEASTVIESNEKVAPSPQEPVPRRQETDLAEENLEISRKQETDLMEENTEMDINEKNSGSVRKYSEGGALHVEGTRLTDSTGAYIQLRGTSTHGLAWFPQYVNREFFLELGKEWNVNVVRLAMYTAESGGYCTGGDKEKLKQLVKDGIHYATEADLYVIVDWHILSDGNPHTYKEEAKKFFEEISGEFAEQENIIYEICNEPNGDVSWADVKSYAEEIIPIIRANDEDAVVIVGTPTWSQDVDKAAEDPITSYDNIMYTLHFYAATHTDWLRERMVNTLNAGLPIFVSEFGTCDASGNGGIDYEQSDAWIKKMDEYGVSYVTWNLSNKGETSAIFRSGCNKESGFSEEDFSENGKWIWKMLTGEHVTPNDTAIQAVEASQSGDEKKTSKDEGLKPEEVIQTNSITGICGDIQYTAVISNSWEAEGKFFYQYNLTLKNISEQEVEDWKITLEFSDLIMLSDSWNGNYTENGNALEITSKDYNSKIKADGEVLDVGFIVRGSVETKLLEK